MRPAILLVDSIKKYLPVFPVSGYFVLFAQGQFLRFLEFFSANLFEDCLDEEKTFSFLKINDLH